MNQCLWLELLREECRIDAAQVMMLEQEFSELRNHDHNDPPHLRQVLISALRFQLSFARFLPPQDKL